MHCVCARFPLRFWCELCTPDRTAVFFFYIARKTRTEITQKRTPVWIALSCCSYLFQKHVVVVQFFMTEILCGSQMFTASVKSWCRIESVFPQFYFYPCYHCRNFCVCCLGAGYLRSYNNGNNRVRKKAKRFWSKQIHVLKTTFHCLLSAESCRILPFPTVK